MVILSKVAENLQELLDERGLTQTALAKEIGTCSSKMSSYLTGKRAPNYETLLSLVEYFHCSADFVLGLTEYPKEEVEYKPAFPFGEQLRLLLSEAEKSQYRFVKETGISWSVFYNWLTGKTLPSADNLVRIADYLSCTVDHVLGRV